MSTPLLAHVVNICRWLEADAEMPYEKRLDRDRRIGRELSCADDLARVLAWWQLVREGEVSPTEGTSLGERLTAFSRLAAWLLGLFGVLLGAGLGTVAFAYDGTHPVNLLGLLGALVGLPFVLLLFTLLFLLPVRFPGLTALREGIGVVNPGRWAGAWLDRYAGMRLYGGFAAGRTRFARWQLVVFSQWLAVGYFVGVLVAGTVLVTVTDLAFGWSTTLDLDAASVARLFAFLAFPWQCWLPSAVPDLGLVEASRIYRLETSTVDEALAMQLGTWWPFVLFTILVWGLLPRLLLLAAGVWRLAAAVRALLCQHAEVLALLDRLKPPRVDFGPEERPGTRQSMGAVAAPPAVEPDSRSIALVWNGALGVDAVNRWGQAHLGGAFGGLFSLSSRSGQAGTRAELARLPEKLSRVVVFTKGWEPPLLEFADFLQALRHALGAGAVLIVVPIDTRGVGVSASDRKVWSAFLAGHDDPRLYVQQATEDPDPASAPAGGDS
ncbi:MAG TPA: DUF2868 domain-containing protein [Pseudomonadales bacterium]